MATFFTFSLLLLLLLLQVPTPLTAAQPPDDGGSGDPVSPGMLIVIVAAFFFSGLIFLVFRLVFLYSGCCDPPLDGDDDGQSGDACRPPPPEGLTPEAIQGIPTYLYKDVKMHRRAAKAELECAVCLNEFQDKEELRRLLECDHVFHLHCVDPWLSLHATCPICRTDIRPPSDNQLPELNQPNVSSDHVAVVID